MQGYPHVLLSRQPILHVQQTIFHRCDQVSAAFFVRRNPPLIFNALDRLKDRLEIDGSRSKYAEITFGDILQVEIINHVSEIAYDSGNVLNTRFDKVGRIDSQSNRTVLCRIKKHVYVVAIHDRLVVMMMKGQFQTLILCLFAEFGRLPAPDRPQENTATGHENAVLDDLDGLDGPLRTQSDPPDAAVAQADDVVDLEPVHDTETGEVGDMEPAQVADDDEWDEL